MPCVVHLTPEELRREKGSETKRRERLESAANAATRAACEAFTLLEEYVEERDLLLADVVSATSLAWWRDHQRRDKARKAKLRESALKKLSAEEKEALGLK